MDSYERQIVNCSQSVISCHVLENAVWSVICTLLLEPTALISALESDFLGEKNSQVAHQASFIEGQIEEKRQEDERLYKAYVAGAFDETEYAERRSLLRAQFQRLEQELVKLQRHIMTAVEFEARKNYIMEFSRRVQEDGAVVTAPYDAKRRILKMIVDRIVLNTAEGWFRIEGVFPGIYPIHLDDENPPKSSSGSIVSRHSAAATRSASPACAPAKPCSTWAAAAALTVFWRRVRLARRAT